MLLLVRFLVFEFEIVFIVISLLEMSYLVLMIII